MTHTCLPVRDTERDAKKEVCARANVWTTENASEVVAEAKKFLEKNMSVRSQAELLKSFQKAYAEQSLTSLTDVIRLIERQLNHIAHEQNAWKMNKDYVRNNDGFFKIQRYLMSLPSRVW